MLNGAIKIEVIIMNIEKPMFAILHLSIKTWKRMFDKYYENNSEMKSFPPNRKTISKELSLLLDPKNETYDRRKIVNFKVICQDWVLDYSFDTNSYSSSEDWFQKEVVPHFYGNRLGCELLSELLREQANMTPIFFED